ncbi:fatty acid desaturase family protein [Streptomyces albireticuli]|uniref:Fatty acid desaturase n=1 Tax=Streptomyces albireticuli TaxID=1940 RepID=A0A2A2CYY3_9ACTN|nr:acyl-CoA desaturase [Streptomyces albireticuli]MCD9145639.1 acyl-CoA desaturase [Streptomyces albireticuli]MCD9165629.1 acyl-CoA desaturase [Streptomyces albireticuli]MCD9196316.1 acyl-CoA desaturase [Streptomyces albireticuli]PAU44376.1 fatty acid desaturase [Streptomyces albireticuli]
MQTPHNTTTGAEAGIVTTTGAEAGSATTTGTEAEATTASEAGAGVRGEAGASPAAAGASATFAELARQVKAEGLLELRPAYYLGRLTLNTTLLAAGLTAFFLIGDSWWQIPVALWMGLCGAQSSFLWHDAGHKAMFRGKRASAAVGYVHANLVNGVSYGWWLHHHNRHHSHPNHLQLDPDIGRRTAIFDLSQYPARQGTQRLIVRYQSVLFFVLLVLESAKMQRTAVKAIAGGLTRRPALECTLILTRLALYLAAAFTVLSPVLAMVFVVVQQATLGVYFGLLFAPNHKGMRIRGGALESLDWLERQVLTSRNIRPGPLTDFLYGGLNYQIEHHLFPAMPRKNLPRARRLTRAYCAQRGVPYHEVSLWSSYSEIAAYLHKVSAPIRRSHKTDTPLPGQ